MRNKAIWKLQPDELARHISPDEWQYVAEYLEGLIVEEGTSAIVYVNGQQVAEMGSGIYVFDDRHQIAAQFENNLRQNEREGFFARVYRLFTGHRRNENSLQRAERERRIQQIIEHLKRDTAIDVYLKSDRVFPAIFGPFDIQTRHLDVEVGVSMQMKIGSFKEFITNYMAGYKSVSIDNIVRSVEGSVNSSLRYQLKDIEVSERGLDKVTFNMLRELLTKNLSRLLHGVAIVEILDITTSSDDLKRFREVESRLYCSEQEYDFLLRTNEFRNRIASEENEQKIREARSEQELRMRLDEINKDNLLHTDEMEQFVSLLMNQKAIREATNKADLDKAIYEIERNRLVSREEFEIFLDDLDNRRFDRAEVSEQMRARSVLATDLNKRDIDRILLLSDIDATKNETLAAFLATEEISDAEWEAHRKERSRDAEDWDWEAIVYGRKYVLDRQKLIDLAEKRGLGNKALAEEIAGRNLEDDYKRTTILDDHNLYATIEDDDYQRRLHKLDAEYVRERRKKEDDLDRLKRLQELEQDVEDRETNRELRKEREKLEMEMKALQAEHEQQLERLREEHDYGIKTKSIEADVQKTLITTEGNMGADQLIAKKIGSMDRDAQVQFAESFGNIKETELIKKSAAEKEKLYEYMVNTANENGVNIGNIQKDNINNITEILKEVLSTFKEMNRTQSGGQQGTLNTLVGAMQSFANIRLNDVKDMKNEYRDQMQHEQKRTDETQRQSLDSMTRVRVSENTPNVVKGTSVNVNIGSVKCPKCGQQIDGDDATWCHNCGSPLK